MEYVKIERSVRKLLPALGRSYSNFKSMIFKLISQNSNMDTRCEIALR